MGHDTIRLSGLRLSGRHGVLDFEKRDAQPFLVDAELQVDLREAGRSDSLSQTISYAEAADIIEGIVTGETYDLIEALAETIAAALLSHDQRIQAVTVTVHKPHAPLSQAFDDVAVTVHRSRADIQQGPTVEEQLSARDRQIREQIRPSAPTPAAPAPTEDDEATVHLRDPELAAAFPVRCVLALGSNLGDSQTTVASAVQALEAAEGVVVVNASPVARTKPVGGPQNQRDYLNQVVEIEARLSPHELLDVAQRIEADHNRVREQRWGPRTLDLDIVTYAGAVIDSPRLQVPHPSAAERAFVLLPWAWMDPLAVLNGRAVQQLAEQAADFDEVTRLSDFGDSGDAAEE